MPLPAGEAPPAGQPNTDYPPSACLTHQHIYTAIAVRLKAKVTDPSVSKSARDTPQEHGAHYTRPDLCMHSKY